MTTFIPYESAVPNTSNSSFSEIPVGDRDPHTSTTVTPENSIPHNLQGINNDKAIDNSSAEVLAEAPQLAHTSEVEPSIISNFTEKPHSSDTLDSSSIINKTGSLNLNTIPLPSNPTTVTQTQDYTKESLKILGYITLAFAIFFFIGLIPIIRKHLKERKQRKLSEVEFDEFQRSLEHSTDPVEINRNYRLKKYPIPAMRRSSSSIISYSRHPRGLMIQTDPIDFSTPRTSLTRPPPVRKPNVQHQSFVSDLSYPTTTYSLNLPIRYEPTD
ncbi:uncharacterized protein MELLADRAFT_109657 [Melampsora larici-populina 98AG31]|uniref:Uncharacterized protein n=1 Tax=Melampsora larici-populina (strain 98AG31 / pathotype 3-4-7) TaxID=747676 RepID=F4RX76_MELLP|nr:uncharacterized protein MELLADRAFT_109657 [Melampsora larici-populina 98AG31]EGG02920.1 hypothetical protein MELLADRAFT_109657 [Melampsora larici-populina 98AG31]